MTVFNQSKGQATQQCVSLSSTCHCLPLRCAQVLDAVSSMVADANGKFAVLGDQLKMQTQQLRTTSRSSRTRRQLTRSSLRSSTSSASWPRGGDGANHENFQRGVSRPTSERESGSDTTFTSIPPFFMCRFDVEATVRSTRVFLVYDVRRESTAMALLQVKNLAVDVLSQPLSVARAPTAAGVGANGNGSDSDYGNSNAGGGATAVSSGVFQVGGRGNVALKASLGLSVYSRNLRAVREASAVSGLSSVGGVATVAASAWEPVVEPFNTACSCTYTAYVVFCAWGE